MAKRQSRALEAELSSDTLALSSMGAADTGETLATVELDPRSIELSEPYLGRWATLISTTNWEKGRIICEWRTLLSTNGSPATAFSDEVWSRQVGGVTPQHVGRLRRVHERFGSQHQTFDKLYWSHFLAALDWDDAEMWLEGASQSRWSVSQMRRTRWEAMGGDPQSEPRDSDLVMAGQDDDFKPDRPENSYDEKGEPREIAEGPRFDGPDFGDDDNALGGQNVGEATDIMPWDDAPAVPAESPFVNLPKLPVDVADALEQFKLAIIRHRSSGWTEVSKDDLTRVLEALRLFAIQ